MEQTDNQKDVEMDQDQNLDMHRAQEEEKEQILDSEPPKLDIQQSVKEKKPSIMDGLSKDVKETRDALPVFKYTKRVNPNLEWRDIHTDPRGYKYLGQWNPKTNKEEGVGIVVWMTGSIYEGYMKNGCFDGKGRLIFTNGAYYEGDFQNGWRQGKGIY